MMYMYSRKRLYSFLFRISQDLIASVDQDGDGLISFNEFVALMEKDSPDDDLRDQIREAFRVFDEEDLGYIPADKLTEILTTIGDKLTFGQYVLNNTPQARLLNWNYRGITLNILLDVNYIIFNLNI